MASCADEFNTNNYPVDRPARLAEYAYLNDYQPLKSYVDHNKNANFKLGVGTTASNYLKKQLEYALVNSNFEETEPGNCMKMGSVVNDRGEMNFGTVSEYVNAATDAGLSVYGHTLAWHAQQPVKWLTSLLKDKELDIDPDAKIEVEVYKQDWTKAGGYSMWGQFPAGVTSGPVVDNNGLTLTSTGTTSGFWELQYMVADGLQFKEGVDYVLKINVKGNPANDNLHYVVGAWGNDVKTGVLDFKDEWATKTVRFTSTGDLNGVHILLQSGDYVGTYTVKDVQVCEIVKMNSIPLTPEQKKDTLTWAMDKWISGMMEACDGKVKAWDVVNEAIGQGEKLTDGFYALQHGKEGDTENFFWQDYLGDLDYVRSAVAMARFYGPEDIKLFINDYNLESDWDDNLKVKSLINWIGKWESDGITKIDGIGSQMHISCYADKAVQERKKAAIENMLKLLAASGKLVRISELDMGYVDANGKDVITAEMTEDQHKEMAALYNWIIQKYFEIIPVNQQWGICQWCITDAPADSGWRKNQPVGLWDSEYYRKHVYAGFATGLAGKPYEPGK